MQTERSGLSENYQLNTINTWFRTHLVQSWF